MTNPPPSKKEEGKFFNLIKSICKTSCNQLTLFQREKDKRFPSVTRNKAVCSNRFHSTQQQMLQVMEEAREEDTKHTDQEGTVFATQSCPALCNAVDCSPPGSSVHGILPARMLEWVARFLLQGIFSTQESNLGLLRCFIV